MISDVLGDAVEGIDRYLKADLEACPEGVRQHILRVRSEMKVLQTRLDVPPAAVELDGAQQEVIDTYRARRCYSIETTFRMRLWASLASLASFAGSKGRIVKRSYRQPRPAQCPISAQTSEIGLTERCGFAASDGPGTA